jgi:DNA-binding GntR family transcriptional regulator
LDGYFQPGERLDQEKIAEELGVSRTPLREAIAALESEGLLESKPHRGVFVIKVTRKDIREVFALRALLEGEVARQATSSITDIVLDRLEASLKEAQKEYADGNYVAQFEADRHFHETLRQFTENHLLKEVLDGVNNRISAVRRFAQTRPGVHIEEFAQEHFAILEAVRQRDGEQAAALMRVHLEKSASRVAELMDV